METKNKQQLREGGLRVSVDQRRFTHPSPHIYYTAQEQYEHCCERKETKDCTTTTTRNKEERETERSRMNRYQETEAAPRSKDDTQMGKHPSLLQINAQTCVVYDCVPDAYGVVK